MENDAKQKAKSFIRKYRIKDNLTTGKIKEIIQSQGYTIVSFSKTFNDENTELLINKLNLKNYIISYSAFVYHDDTYRLVFIEENLSDDEKLILLTHEEGHIFCNHLGKNVIAGKTIIDEHEANEFAHYILYPSVITKMRSVICKHKATSIIISALLVIGIACSITVPLVYRNSLYYGEYYVTPSGEKFHKPSCYYVKDKKNIRRLTKEEIENNTYAPCKVCLPELQEEN